MKTLNTIPGVSHSEMTQLRRVFESDPLIREVILYGSRAKQTHRPGSDIDLTLKGEGLSTGFLMDLLVKIDDLLLPYEVDLSILDHIDNSDLLGHIERIGKVVFSNV
jgi:predicted nucleotidyltransferase